MVSLRRTVRFGARSYIIMESGLLFRTLEPVKGV